MGHWSKVSCAALLLTLALSAPAAAATYPNAIVLVSGVESLTPFTTPDPSCAGQEGNAWSPMVAPTLKGAQLAVFTAPVAPNGKSNPSCAAGGPDVSAAMEINSNGDVDAGGLALSEFLTFLQQSYGVATVQLVGHSDGGLWSRSAITQLQGGPAILSLTTIGTPHTGSWVADVGTHASNFPCTGLKNGSRCAVARAVAKIVFADIGETAMYELSSPFLETWNPQQVIGACPVTTLAGTASDDSVFSDASLYYNPSDGLVGEASGLNQDAEALDGSTIPAAPGLDVVARQTFPDFHTPALGEPDELSDAALAAVVLSAVQSGATNTTTCGVVGVRPPPPSPPPPPPPPATVGVQLRTGSAPGAGGQLPPTQPGDAIVATGRTRVACDRRRVASHSVRGHAELRVTIPGRCRRGLTARGGKALLLRGVRGTRLELVLRDGHVRVVERKGHLRRIRLEARVDRRWRHLKLDAKLRAKLPRHATGLRVSGRIKGGRRASGVAMLSPALAP
jgi:triacylglycerol lipase